MGRPRRGSRQIHERLTRRLKDQLNVLGNLLRLDQRKRACKDFKSLRNSIAFMKQVTIHFAMILFLPCLGIGEEVMQPVGPACHRLQFAQLSSKDQSHAKICLEAVAPKLHRHRHAKYRTNIAPAGPDGIQKRPLLGTVGISARFVYQPAISADTPAGGRRGILAQDRVLRCG